MVLRPDKVLCCMFLFAFFDRALNTIVAYHRLRNYPIEAFVFTPAQSKKQFFWQLSHAFSCSNQLVPRHDVVIATALIKILIALIC